MLSDAYSRTARAVADPGPDSIRSWEWSSRLPSQDGAFMPYLRDPETLARPWAVPDAGSNTDRRARRRT
jgi:2-oxoglutarate ferredoxin oxidoreductase subunit alpha